MNRPTWIPGVAGARSKETFNGFNLAITEGVVFHVTDLLVIRGSNFVDGECGVAFNSNFRKRYLPHEFGGDEAFLFIPRQRNMIVSCWACECKIFCKLAGYHIPVFLFIAGKIGSDRLFCAL